MLSGSSALGAVCEMSIDSEEAYCEGRMREGRAKAEQVCDSFPAGFTPNGSTE
jgi:hypothetical protein